MKYGCANTASRIMSLLSRCEQHTFQSHTRLWWKHNQSQADYTNSFHACILKYWLVLSAACRLLFLFCYICSWHASAFSLYCCKGEMERGRGSEEERRGGIKGKGRKNGGRMWQEGDVNKAGAVGEAERGGVDGVINVVQPLTADGQLCIVLCCLATTHPTMHSA